MITLISASNRKNSYCLHFANHFYRIFEEKTTIPVKLLSLKDLPTNFLTPNMYTLNGQHPAIKNIQDSYILPADKFFFVMPEYNGSFPGVLKSFVDACSIREYSKNFDQKKAALVGVATGRAGNIRGMDHFSDILNYLGTVVMPNKLPISSIKSLMDDNQRIIDQKTLKVMEEQVATFLNF